MEVILLNVAGVEEKVETILCSSPMLPKDISSLMPQQSPLTPRINELLATIDRKYAEKDGTYKALKYLERLLRVIAKSGMNSNNDPILAKRPLGGWSCASCEKSL